MMLTLFYVTCSLVSVSHAFECVRDVPSVEFLTQKNSYIDYFEIDSETVLEVQIFNADKLDTLEQTPLLFIHGYTDSRWSFLSTVQCLDIDDRVIIVPSLRGFGDSQIYSLTDSLFSIEEFAADLSTLLDLLSIDSAVWIGHSMGSWVAHYAAGNMPDKVQSAMLLSSGPELDDGLCAAIDSYINGTCPDRDFIDAFQEKTVIAESISSAYANQVVRESYKVDLAPLQNAWYELCDYESVASNLGSIQMNITVIWGSEDGVTPINDDFVAMFSAAKVSKYVIDGVGHNVQWFAPQQVADIVKTHIGYEGEKSSSSDSKP